MTEDLTFAPFHGLALLLTLARNIKGILLEIDLVEQ